MSDLQVFLRLFDDATSHRWESLESALDGVGETEAFWQAPAYAGEAPEEGWPVPGTLAWQVAHVLHSKRHYTDCILAVGASESPAARPWTPAGTFAALRRLLAEVHAEQRAALAALSDGDLDRLAGNRMPMREFLGMCIRHDTWHAAQIAVARRLYRVAHPEG